jgi:F-type H+-transporting ATPase subunit gamma
MSKRRELERRLHGLGEIRDIMNAMKNLSMMETLKLARFLADQQRVVAAMESAAADVLFFHPDILPDAGEWHDVCLLLGSERGFCGDFNEALLQALNGHQGFPQDTVLAVVGSRLAGKISGDPRVAVRLDGPNVVEEVEAVLMRLMDALKGLRDPLRPLRLSVFHRQAGEDDVKISVLQPFRPFKLTRQSFSHPPLLNMEPRVFLGELAGQYLFAALHELFYSSLMAENQRRMQHMDHAVRRIEQDSTELQLKRNVLRQEEIIEEIEVIMLSVEALA